MKVQAALVLILLSFVFVNAQEATSAAETVDSIKLKLLDLQARQEELKYRLIELDEAIKPENIARSLAGVGSTRPEELREARRKQLAIERDSIQAQLRGGVRDFEYPHDSEIQAVRVHCGGIGNGVHGSRYH